MSTSPTSRLRKTFHYPSSSSSSSALSDVDEEHQERLIETLSTRDADQTNLYRHLFTLIPLSAALISLSALLRGHSPLRQTLSTTSLCATAYILYYQPIPAKDHKGKTPLYKLEVSPLEKYLLPADAVLAGLLGVAAAVDWRQGRVAEAWQAALPGLIFGICMFARQQLAPVDLEALKAERFELKGA